MLQVSRFPIQLSGLPGAAADAPTEEYPKPASDVVLVRREARRDGVAAYRSRGLLVLAGAAIVTAGAVAARAEARRRQRRVLIDAVSSVVLY